jgi:arsenate reductase
MIGGPMLENVILHNPRCSKSRAVLALLQQRDVDVRVVEYLKTPPSAAELQEIGRRLGKPALQMMRTKESRFRELGLSTGDRRSDQEWFRILADNPVLIERPIVIYRGRAAIGRPPENILKILE